MRSRVFGTLAFLAQCITIGLALAFVVALLWPSATTALRARLGLAAETAGNPAPAQAATAPPPAAAVASYAAAVDHAAPSVVNIYANKVVAERRVRIYPDPLMQRLFGGVAFGPAYLRKEQSLGSGVIFSTDGYVLTNNHVISGADEIQVLLYDNRVAHATVVGTDPLTDLAVLKIPEQALPAIDIAEAQPLEVGDVVLAIGNPFGIGQTVTMGIVSGLQRQLTSSIYENFIQTDAAINSGNSGGALVNAAGELVGINTAMLGRQTGAEGIGFAIPVATAELVMRQIIDQGQVTRGWIGADFRSIAGNTRDPRSLPDHGALVVRVYPGSPAALAGIQPGDILLQLNQQPIAGPGWLMATEASLAPGTAVDLSGLRGGQSVQFSLKLMQRPKGLTSGTSHG